MDERYICKGECYKFKRADDIKRGFLNNFDFVIEMPKYHAEVYWDLAEDLSQKSQFHVQQQRADTIRKPSKSSIVSGMSHYYSEMRGNMSVKSQALEESAANSEVKNETEQIKVLKNIIHEFPREKQHKDYNRHLVQKYRYFVPNIAMYVRSIDFTNN